MILAHGKLYENNEQDAIIAALPQEFCRTLATEPLTSEEVILACDALSRRAASGEYDAIARPLLEMAQLSYDAYLEYCEMFSAAALRAKLETELCGLPEEGYQVSEQLFRMRRPLGVLLHIAAGNVDALPAYSVMEGLLAGNINILKLPTGDSGVSVKLLSELIRECPKLKDYIYVFDVPSTEIETIRQLANLSDGVVVWGGDAAVRAAHRMIDPATRLIVWGHKLSFAYASPDATDAMLRELARDICKTEQMLCSSCQGIYVDTDDRETLQAFGVRFFEILKQVNRTLTPAPRGMRAKNTLRLYNDRLEGRHTILSEEGVSVIVKDDDLLELSYLFRNIWIKALPRVRILPVLKPYRGHLQSCALLMPEGADKETALSLLTRAGLTRITTGSLSRMLPGEAHDGVFPLREYCRVVDVLR